MEVLEAVSTGDTLAKKYGFEPKLPALANWPDETIKFLLADEVKELGKLIITKWRSDLQNIDIAYLFKQKASKSGDTVTMGTAKCENEKQKCLHGMEAVIEIGFDTWKDLELDQ